MLNKYKDHYFDQVYKVVHETIGHVYPNYYPLGVVNFFHIYHRKENMHEDLPKGVTYVVFHNKEIVATGSAVENEIKRMFVLPNYQGKKYGKILLAKLEESVKENGFNTAELDASLGAYDFYKKHGYSQTDYRFIDSDNNHKLCYFRMKKSLSNISYLIDYNNKVFIPESNSESGEVDKNTKFYYYQSDNVIWATYDGGAIQKGFLVGTVDNEGRLQFSYEHINTENQIRTGMCKSYPEIDESGKITLHENWQWTNGDKSKGSSKLIEV